jgi:hypothetical protein
MLDGYLWDRFATYTVNMQAKPDTVHTMFRNHLAFVEKQTGLPKGSIPNSLQTNKAIPSM